MDVAYGCVSCVMLLAPADPECKDRGAQTARVQNF